VNILFSKLRDEVLVENPCSDVAGKSKQGPGDSRVNSRVRGEPTTSFEASTKEMGLRGKGDEVGFTWDSDQGTSVQFGGEQRAQQARTAGPSQVPAHKASQCWGSLARRRDQPFFWPLPCRAQQRKPSNSFRRQPASNASDVRCQFLLL
jgi:hypothetical protein